MITNDKVNIEEKQEPRLEAMNCFQRLIVSSNDVDIIDIGPNDRRWIVLNPYNIDNKKEKLEFFTNVYADIRDKNIVRMFYDELIANNIDEKYNFQINRPATKYYEMLKIVNAPFIVKFFHGANISDKLDNLDNTVSGTQLYDHFCNWLLSNGIKYEFTNTKFGLDITKEFLKVDFIKCGIKKIRTSVGIKYIIDIDKMIDYIENTLNYNGDF